MFLMAAAVCGERRMHYGQFDFDTKPLRVGKQVSATAGHAGWPTISWRRVGGVAAAGCWAGKLLGVWGAQRAGLGPEQGQGAQEAPWPLEWVSRLQGREGVSAVPAGAHRPAE